MALCKFIALGLLGVSVLHLFISWKILAALLVDKISNNMQKFYQPMRVGLHRLYQRLRSKRQRPRPSTYHGPGNAPLFSSFRYNA